MAFHYDTICHFRCNNLLSPPDGTLSLLFGLESGTRGMWAVMQMAGEEEISRHTIDCPCRGHLLKHGFVLSCSAQSCYEKALNGPSRKHNSAFSCHCVFPVGPMPQTLLSTLLSLTTTHAITCGTVALSKVLADSNTHVLHIYFANKG